MGKIHFSEKKNDCSGHLWVDKFIFNIISVPVQLLYQDILIHK